MLGLAQVQRLNLCQEHFVALCNSTASLQLLLWHVCQRALAAGCGSMSGWPVLFSTAHKCPAATVQGLSLV
jgi:hypothetical protein